MEFFVFIKRESDIEDKGGGDKGGGLMFVFRFNV